jgi:hypothetical protein
MLLHPDASNRFGGQQRRSSSGRYGLRIPVGVEPLFHHKGFIREAPRVWGIEAVQRLKMRDEGRFARSRLRAHALEFDKRAAGFIRPPGVRADERVAGPVRAQPIASPPPRSDPVIGESWQLATVAGSQRSTGSYVAEDYIIRINDIYDRH